MCFKHRILRSCEIKFELNLNNVDATLLNYCVSRTAIIIIHVI